MLKDQFNVQSNSYVDSNLQAGRRQDAGLDIPYNNIGNKVIVDHDNPSTATTDKDESASKSKVRILSHCCKSWFCSLCSMLLRTALLEKLYCRYNSDQKLFMLTLTVAPKKTEATCGFCSAERAHNYISKEQKLVARLLKKLSVKQWTWFLEFNSEGWPHWHVLLDASNLTDEDCSGLRAKAESYWYGQWGIGTEVDIREVDNLDRAIEYVTKTLGTGAEEYQHWPEWVLNGSHMKLYTSSRSKNTKDAAGKDNEPNNEPPKQHPQSLDTDALGVIWSVYQSVAGKLIYLY